MYIETRPKVFKGTTPISTETRKKWMRSDKQFLNSEGMGLMPSAEVDQGALEGAMRRTRNSIRIPSHVMRVTIAIK